MRISSAGNDRRGITLLELLVVLAIIALMVGISVPATVNGLSSIRLRSAADDVSSFLNSALNRSERREQMMEVFVFPKQARLEADSTEPGFVRTLDMPPGISIAGDNPQRIVLMPGSAPPRVAIDLFNDHGIHRVVKLDPVTGVPEVVVAQGAAQ
ncbi:MAG TPA: prepilin-type N-terminal cleavage/methylation domain-containing protein [Bryobacteraceae bacterium]|jgi:prepilin-type N-terminal cleavage/methylation domain-containing protein